MFCFVHDFSLWSWRTQYSMKEKEVVNDGENEEVEKKEEEVFELEQTVLFYVQAIGHNQ